MPEDIAVLLSRLRDNFTKENAAAVLEAAPRSRFHTFAISEFRKIIEERITYLQKSLLALRRDFNSTLRQDFVKELHKLQAIFELKSIQPYLGRKKALTATRVKCRAINRNYEKVITAIQQKMATQFLAKKKERKPKGPASPKRKPRPR